MNRYTFGVEMWGIKNLAIMQRVQSKALRMLLNPLWYVSNNIIHEDLKMFMVQNRYNKRSSINIKEN